MQPEESGDSVALVTGHYDAILNTTRNKVVLILNSQLTRKLFDAFIHPSIARFMPVEVCVFLTILLRECH